MTPLFITRMDWGENNHSGSMYKAEVKQSDSAARGPWWAVMGPEPPVLTTVQKLFSHGKLEEISYISSYKYNQIFACLFLKSLQVLSLASSRKH